MDSNEQNTTIPEMHNHPNEEVQVRRAEPVQVLKAIPVEPISNSELFTIADNAFTTANQAPASSQNNNLNTSVTMGETMRVERAIPVESGDNSSDHSLNDSQAIPEEVSIEKSGNGYLHARDKFPRKFTGQYLVGEFILLGEYVDGGAVIYAVEDETRGLMKRQFVIKNYSTGLGRGEYFQGNYKPRLSFTIANPLIITGKLFPGLYTVDRTK
jgi:hypothetical protein